MVFLFVVFCLQSGTWYGSVEFLEWSCVEGEDFLLLLIFFIYYYHHPFLLLSSYVHRIFLDFHIIFRILDCCQVILLFKFHMDF